jgi:BlaI family penicillinase repressor
MNNYFDNSYKSLVSFIADDKNLGIKELDELTELINKLKNKKQ